ncbi:unnamed protein product [Mycena citricolor]|uniref:Uncharacterized protein n=1 Tax=Mycena citricolor TaxID=2018698 RepID=A0AAD2HYS5_9AGAR|nr:unnamed protein product [Mycena citricolor]
MACLYNLRYTNSLVGEIVAAEWSDRCSRTDLRGVPPPGACSDLGGFRTHPL